MKSTDKEGLTDTERHEEVPGMFKVGEQEGKSGIQGAAASEAPADGEPEASTPENTEGSSEQQGEGDVLVDPNAGESSEEGAEVAEESDQGAEEDTADEAVEESQ